MLPLLDEAGLVHNQHRVTLAQLFNDVLPEALSRCRDGRVRSSDEECKIALPQTSLSGGGHQLRGTL
ncbi:hypothetical protein, partial [Paraburkholderia aspalathi]|uniref:hypothetical protein n=1 Tax=Paraburkholderia aspalathi TaxID=1324617 RepID=UPI001BAC4D0F